MALDIKTELANALALHAQAQADLRTAADTLHLAGIHLTNVRDMLKPKPLPELAVSIVDNSDYGDMLKESMRGYVDKIAASKVRRVMIFQNYYQMVQDKFPQYAIDRGLQVDFDTMYSVWRTTTPAQRIEYMTQAEKFKPQGYHLDDGHNQTPVQLKPVVDWIRGYSDAPIYISMAADDSRLPVKEVKKNAAGEVISKTYWTMQDYKAVGLLVTRQFFRHEQVKKNPANRTGVVDTWLKATHPVGMPGGEGRILDGVNLEAFRAGTVTTSPQDFEAMLLKCLNAGIEFLSVYAAVNSPKWQMWQAAPDLWQAVQAGAETVRLWKQ
jgi:hypothetical protein